MNDCKYCDAELDCCKLLSVWGAMPILEHCPESPMDIQKAIKFAESEIRSLELAPEINGCEMTEDWKELIEVWETIIYALKKYESEVESE